MSRGDDVLISSPRTTYPHGDALRALTVAGEITGAESEPSKAIPGGSRRAARLREWEPPLSLEEIRDRFLELDPHDCHAISARPEKRPG